MFGLMFDFNKYYTKLQLLKDEKNSALVLKIRRKILNIVTSDKFSPKLHKYLSSINPNEGQIPFTDFSEDPEQISQIKKILNALYHAEKALIVLETMDLGYKDVFKIMGKLGPAREHAYQACMLFTHLDIDLSDIFADEIVALTPIFTKLQTYVANVGDAAKGVLSNVEVPDISHRAGVIAGVAVNQMKAENGVDYEFITHFTSLVPGYIDQLTGYIKTFSSTVSKHDKSIDKEKLDELQDHALKLLKALKGLNSNYYMLPMKVLHFIHIISHTLTLSNSIIQQIGLLDKSTQDVIRKQLATLKYQYLPEIFAFVDKVEMQMMANPGFLSKPIMKSMTSLYGTILEYAQKIVNFSEKGEELLTINDTWFVAARLKPTYQRISNDQKKLLALISAKKALNAFFTLLNHEEYRGQRLVDLPQEIKDRLILHFKTMMPFVLEYDARLHDAFILGLTRKKGNFEGVKKAWHAWIQTSAESVKDILSKRPLLEARFNKIQQSLKFHTVLNMDMIHYVSRETEDLKLTPPAADDKPFMLDEASEAGIVQGEEPALQVADLIDGKRVINLDALSTEQTIKLHNAYQMKILQLGQAIKSYNTFARQLNGLSTANKRNRFGQDWQKTIVNAYNAFRPFLNFSSSIYGTQIQAKLTSVDQAIIQILNKPEGLRPACYATILRRIKQTILGIFTRTDSKTLSTERDIIIDALFSHDPLIQQFLREARRDLHTVQEKFQQRSKVLTDLLQRKLVNDAMSLPMVTMISKTDRAYHLIKHEDFSKVIVKIRQSVTQFVNIFNESVRAQLTPQAHGLPFPGLEDANLTLEESDQVLGPKQLLNGLYHLEQASLGLEKLTDQLSKNDYLTIVLEVRGHFIEAMNLAKALTSNPFLMVMTSEIKEQFQKGYQILKDLRAHYFPSDVELQTTEGAQTKHGAVFYSLNTMMILPVHIALCREGQSLTPDKTRAIHRNAEKMVTNIDRIISHASSYFKLFLDIPVMYSMFGEFKKKLIELSSTTSGVVLDNLSPIHEDLFARMLVEADRWEGNFGLNPGTLTDTLKEVLDELYQGLLEPLSFPSKKHLALVASPVSLQKRFVFALTTEKEAIAEQAIIEEKQQRLTLLLQAIKTYKHKVTSIQGRSILVDAYTQALPTLRDEASHYMSDIALADTHFVAFNEWIHSTVSLEPPLKNMEALASACLSYLNGRHATQRVIQKTAEEKREFLAKLNRTEETRIKEYTVKYSRQKFKEQVALLSAKPVGLIHCMGEYTQKLKAHLSLAEEEVVTIAKSAEDIKLKIEELLSERAEKFEQEHYKNYFHLEQVKEAIERLKIYISGENSRITKKSNLPENKRVTFFEDKNTLAEKSVLVAELDTVSTDPNLNVKERLTKLKALVEKPILTTTLLAGYSSHTVGFVWIVQCLLSLFEFLGIYTPDRKACHHQLLKAIEPPAEPISQLSAQFGLFSSRKFKSDITGVASVESASVEGAPVPEGATVVLA